MANLICGLCNLPIHPQEAGVRRFGTFAAHSENRCIQLLQLQIETARREGYRKGLEEAAEITDQVVREWGTSQSGYGDGRAASAQDIAADIRKLKEQTDG